MWKIVSEKMTPEGRVAIHRLSGKEARQMRETSGIGEEPGFPDLEVHYLNGRTVLAVNCTEEPC